MTRKYTRHFRPYYRKLYKPCRQVVDEQEARVKAHAKRVQKSERILKHLHLDPNTFPAPPAKTIIKSYWDIIN